MLWNNTVVTRGSLAIGNNVYPDESRWKDRFVATSTHPHPLVNSASRGAFPIPVVFDYSLMLLVLISAIVSLFNLEILSQAA